VKKLLKVVGVILACWALLLGVARITGLNQSFADKIRNVKIQTNSSYLLPHPLNINCVSYKGQLYLDSLYAAGLTYPHGRRWNENVARDPHVRIKIGNQLCDPAFALVTNPAEQEAITEGNLRNTLS
jgi:hypothetical protein